MMEVLFALLGAASAALMRVILNIMPAKAFCDYDETPGEQHAAPRAGKWALLCCAVALAVAFPVLYRRIGFGLECVCLWLLSVVLLMILLSDVRYCIIPDELVIAGGMFAIIGALPGVFASSDWSQRLSPVFGAAIGGGVIFGLNCLGRLLYHKDALGMGDLKLMIVCGIACGTSGTIIAMVIGILAAGAFFAGAIVLKRARAQSYMALGPFLVFGTMFTLCFRPVVDQFVAWYVSLII